MTNVLEHLQWRYTGHPKDNWITLGFSTGKAYGDWQAFQLSDLEAAVVAIDRATKAKRGVAATVGSASTRHVPGKTPRATGTNLLWVDTDEEPELALQRLQSYQLPPSRIYYSGRRGYHAYWRLNEFETDRNAIEAALYGLMLDLKSDSMLTNLVNLMRIPGTVNPKSGNVCELVAETESVYSLSDFPKATKREFEPRAEDPEPEPLPDGFEVLVKATPDGDYTWFLIHPELNDFKGVPRNRATGEVDHSRLGWSLACRLLTAGFSTGVVMSVLMDTSLVCGQCFAEDGFSQVIRTVTKAEAEIKRLRFEDITIYREVVEEKRTKDKSGNEVTTQVRKPKFNGDLAARSIALHFHLKQSDKRVNYRYVDDHYVRDLGEVIYTTLSNKMPGMLLPVHLHDTETSMRHLLASQLSKPEGDTWIGVENGLLNLRTRQLTDPTPDIFAVHKLPVRFDADRTRDEEVYNYYTSVVRAEEVDTLNEQIGSALTTEVFPWAGAVFLFGKPNSGKSELLHFIEALIGEENYCTVDPAQLTGDKDVYSSVLPGNLANLVHDANIDTFYREVSKLKPIVTGEEFTSNPKFIAPFKVSSYATFIVATNALTLPTNVDYGWLKRLIILTCPNTYSRDTPGFQPVVGRMLAQDPGMLSGALNLALDGLDRQRKNSGYTITSSIQEAKDRYQDASDSVSAYVRGYCTYEPGHMESFARFKKQYNAFCRLIADRKPVRVDTLQDRISNLVFSDPHQKLSIVKERLRGETYESYKVVNLRINEEIDTTTHPSSNGKIYIGSN